MVSSRFNRHTDGIITKPHDLDRALIQNRRKETLRSQVQRVTHALLFPLCAMLISNGCSTSLLVQDAGASGPSVLDQLDSARLIETQAQDGATLFGAFVKATDSQYLVLHLLPSGASVITGVPGGIGRMGLASTLTTLQDEGFSSVVFDYRGVGGSPGSRRDDRLLMDGRAMWQTAVRLAGGRQDRVIIRAGSLGTLIAADLLNQDATPAAVVLFAPIRAQSIVRHAAKAHRGSFGAWFAQMFVHTPAASNLDDAFLHTNTSILLFFPQHDVYLPQAEQEVLRSAAETRAHQIIVLPADHQSLILRSWGFTIDPDGFSGRGTLNLIDAELEFISDLGRTEDSAEH
jgi:pimeloyl-ACP methyl ester carboxylesterase